MKEVTRIHIAKISYDIEIAAKKQLEAYLKTLEAYSTDTEIIQDIEIRITEILDGRGVKKNGVIAEDDIKALKQQLGEPREFMEEGDIALGPEEEERISNEGRKLYRNTQNAVLGGVLSGIAAYFKVNPAWVRLLFIILAFASFGTAVLVYIVLWVVVPPAVTAADKLQMTGRAVTVGSIRALNENESSKSEAHGNSSGRRVATLIVGIICVISAVVVMFVTALISATILFGDHRYLIDNGNGPGLFLAADILATVSGFLLTTLLIMSAYASFMQKITRRVLVSGVVVIVLGLGTFGTAIGLVEYGNIVRRGPVQKAMYEEAVVLPVGNVMGAKSVIINAQGAAVEYVVTTSQPSATLRTMTKEEFQRSRVAITLENDGVLRINTDRTAESDCISLWGCNNSNQTLVVYGPALENITIKADSDVQYRAGDHQARVNVTAEDGVNLKLASGAIDTLKIFAGSNTNIVGSDTNVRHLDAELKISTNLDFGSVETLTIVDTKLCPKRTVESRMHVQAIRSGTMTINGVSQPARIADSGCTEVSIEADKN